MTDPRGEDQSRSRRRAVLTALAGAVTGALLIAGFESAQPVIERWVLAADQPRSRLALLLGGLALLICLPVGVFAVWLWRLDPGARPTRAGRATRWLAMLLMVLVASVLLLFWRISTIL
jgi:hypothetical protein